MRPRHLILCLGTVTVINGVGGATFQGSKQAYACLSSVRMGEAGKGMCRRSTYYWGMIDILIGRVLQLRAQFVQ